jgi:hypothetical protein
MKTCGFFRSAILFAFSYLILALFLNRIESIESRSFDPRKVHVSSATLLAILVSVRIMIKIFFSQLVRLK